MIVISLALFPPRGSSHLGYFAPAFARHAGGAGWPALKSATTPHQYSRKVTPVIGRKPIIGLSRGDIRYQLSELIRVTRARKAFRVCHG
jgi:hypothetical protein